MQKDRTAKMKNVEQASKKARDQQQKQKKGGKGAVDDSAPALLKRPPKDYDVMFEFPDPDEMTYPIIELKDASFGYKPGAQNLIFRDLNFGIGLDSRIAMVGPNGAGKSTLLNLIKGVLEPTVGDIQRNRKLTVAHFSQHFVDQLNYNETPVSYLQRQFPDLSDQGRN
jgi:ATPase subunit of ABC transporter with duplicated ATPase domains